MGADHTHLKQFWLLYLEIPRLITIQLLEQVKEAFMLDNHLHLLLGRAVAMTHNAHYTAQLQAERNMYGHTPHYKKS